MSARQIAALGCVGLAAIGAGACYGSPGDPAGATETVVVTVAAPPAPPPDAPCAGIVVPDVTGGDHQLAQDTLQAAGLYNLAEEDATGQGRRLVLDRDWTVVRQLPAAGTCATAGTRITLFSKKDGE